MAGLQKKPPKKQSDSVARSDAQDATDVRSFAGFPDNKLQSLFREFLTTATTKRRRQRPSNPVTFATAKPSLYEALSSVMQTAASAWNRPPSQSLSSSVTSVMRLCSISHSSHFSFSLSVISLPCCKCAILSWLVACHILRINLAEKEPTTATPDVVILAVRLFTVFNSHKARKMQLYDGEDHVILAWFV